MHGQDLIIHDRKIVQFFKELTILNNMRQYTSGTKYVREVL